MEPLDQPSLELWLQQLRAHHALPTIALGLAKALTTHSGSPVLFSPSDLGISAPPRSGLSKGAICFETASFGMEIAVSMSEEYFNWVFSRMFNRESRESARDSENLMCELLNVTLGIANAHFDSRGHAGRFSFPRPIVAEAKPRCAREAFITPFHCGGDSVRQGTLEFFPAGTLEIPWAFDSASISRPA